MPDWLSALQNIPAVAVALRIGLIIVLAYLAHRSLAFSARQLERRLVSPVADRDASERVQTLIRVGRSALLGLLLVLAGLMILQALGLNVVPLLAGAGVVGLAISLGAQTLVKDFISGMLILVESQFSVGDTIRVGEHQGQVERITLRATFLRDLEGRRYVLPNGDIRAVSNLTVGWSRAIVDLNVSYDADMNAVLGLLQTAAASAGQDPDIADDLLEAPAVIGWNALQDWAVQVRLLAKTRPGRQWNVATVLRKHALTVLESAGIRVAIPRQEVELYRRT